MISKALRETSYFLASALILVALNAVILSRGSTPAPLAPTETVIRFERVIDGKPVQCERREDHVRGTAETAC